MESDETGGGLNERRLDVEASEYFSKIKEFENNAKAMLSRLPSSSTRIGLYIKFLSSIKEPFEDPQASSDLHTEMQDS